MICVVYEMQGIVDGYTNDDARYSYNDNRDIIVYHREAP